MSLSKKRIFTTIFILLIIIHLVLTTGHAFGVRGDLKVDDALFIEHAISILDGDWLGKFDYRTFCKGPIYPLFIAFMHLLGIPLFAGQHILYIVSLLLLCKALEKTLSPRCILALFTVLLFNPVNYSMETTWLLREYVTLSFAIILISCVIAIFFSDMKSKTTAVWLALLAVTFPLFWLIREDGVWLMPFIIFGLFCSWLKSIIFDRNQSLARKIKVLGVLMIPFIGLFAGIISISTINYLHYGVFRTVDTNNGPLKDAYGALLRIKQDNWIPDTPVPKDVREKAYNVSPAFAKLEEYMEGPLGNSLVRYKPEYEDIKGRFFQWALREYASYAGEYESAQTADKYFQAIADEINRACDNGSLECKTNRYSSFMQPWDQRYFPLLVDCARNSLSYITKYQAVNPNSTDSAGSEESIRIFEQITNTPALRKSGANVSVRGWAYANHAPVQLEILDAESSKNIEAVVIWHDSPDIYSGTASTHQGDSRYDYLKECRYEITFKSEDYKKCILRLSNDSGTYDISLTSAPGIYHNSEITCAVDNVSTILMMDRVTASQQLKITTLDKIGNLYRKLNPIFLPLALIGYGILLLHYFICRIKKYTCLYGADLLVLSGIFFTGLLRMGISAAFNLYTAADMRISYFFPVYTLMLIFEVWSIFIFFHNWRRLFLGRKKQ